MKTVGIVLPIGQSKKRLIENGQWYLWKSELMMYKKLGWKHELFEYRSPGLLRFVESFTVPFFARARFEKCDLLQAVHLSGSIPCVIAHLFYGKHFILRYAYRYDEFARIEKKWFQWVFAKLLTPIVCRMTSTVVVPTVEIADFVKRQGVINIAVIPNGVDTALFRPASKGYSLRPQGVSFSNFTILFVGRFEPQKNLISLIKAISLIQDKGSDLSSRSDPFHGRISLVFIGRGSEQQMLDTTAKKLHVSLKFISPVPNDRLVSFYQRADMFVLPSFVEGHPKALLEAMSCGLPVLASRIPGCIDIITDGIDGLLVKPTVSGIADGLIRLITNRKLAARLGKKARETVVKRFDKHRVLEQEIQLMNRLV